MALSRYISNQNILLYPNPHHNPNLFWLLIYRERAKIIQHLISVRLYLLATLKPGFYMLVPVNKALSVVSKGDNYFRYTKDFTNQQTP